MDSWKIKRILRTRLGKSDYYHWLRFLVNKKYARPYFEKYGKNYNETSMHLLKEAWVKYHWNFDEFFLYDFASLSDQQRMSFVSEYEKNIFCDKANNNSADLIFHDKWSTYNTFQKYYKRDAYLLNGLDDMMSSKFVSFIEKHKSFIIKPIYAATGKGIEIIHCENYSDAILKLKAIINNGEIYILEELIVQSRELSVFHPSSVNTIRISTFRYGPNDIEILYPFIKFGTGGNFVDNGGRGGIICSIEPTTGSIIAAIDESPKHYSKHPDTGQQLIGFNIPKWNEVVTLAKELAEVLPEVRYVGWDLALTDNGWVMVEGNEKGMFIGFQLPTHTGFRPHFKLICEKAEISI